jgi:hypothetical protein
MKPETRTSDRRREAPKGGAISASDMRNSDRRCEAPKGGAINGFAERDRTYKAPKGRATILQEME